MTRISRLALTLSCVALMSSPALAAEPDGPATLITRIEAVRITVEDHLSAKLSVTGAKKAEQGALVEYYSVRDQPLLWVDENGLTERAKSVMDEIAKADEYGLRAGDYSLPKADGFKSQDASATNWLADAEIKISFAVLGYARDARGGRIQPSRLSDNLDPTLALPDPLEVMESIAIRSDPAAYLRSFQPGQPQFEALRHTLIQLRGRGSSSNKTGISSGKINTILINMERWRWLPEDLGPYYVNVNVPEFMLRVVEEGKVVHTTRVVVGKPDKQTPIFSQDMQEIVFNPYWNVPNSIKTEELLPSIRGGGGDWFGGGWDTSVFERHGLRVNIGGREVDPLSLDWSRIDIRSLDIYQPPGPENVLGNVKFVFPNKHDVYMHDTTQKSLFAQSIRAESHGCMRVQNPDQLAEMLLKHDQGWTQGRVASAIANGYDQHVKLERRIPVYITYFTAWVKGDGSLETFGDVYGHDARMAAALFGRRVAFEASTDTELGASPWTPPNKRVRQGGALSARALSGLSGN
ncbi:MAG: L,D-transpeptidase family protein [Methyloceanibacter sp.]|jgi:murein L,D-transpeptidase YcbB/YkuD